MNSDAEQFSEGSNLSEVKIASATLSRIFSRDRGHPIPEVPHDHGKCIFMVEQKHAQRAEEPATFDAE